jgi:uncharacterized protein (DUF2147 family)
MKRIVCLIVLAAVGTPASARDAVFVFQGHRIHIHDLRHCRSLSCIRLAIPGLGYGYHGRHRDADLDAMPDAASGPVPAVAPTSAPAAAPATASSSPPASAPPAPVPAPPVQAGPAPAPPPTAAPAQPPPLPPVIAQVGPTASDVPAQTAQPTGRQDSTASTAAAPPSVGFDVPSPQPGASLKSSPAPAEKSEMASQDKPQQETALQPPPTTPQTAQLAAPRLASGSSESDDFADTPLGDWQTEGKNGLVRIEACGASLCGYVLNPSTREKGEVILVNMKPKFETWSGTIFSRSSGNSYYATVRMKEADTLRVEACALGKFFCSGNNWVRLAQARQVHDGTANSRSNGS